MFRKQAFGFCLAIFCLSIFSGCYTYAGTSKNSVPFETADSNVVTWEEASQNIIPLLEDGLMTMSEQDVYKLFKRPPNERQAYSDAISVISQSPALLNIAGHSNGNLGINSTVYIKNKIPKLRGAVWTFVSGNHKNLKTILSEHSWDTKKSFLVLTLFYDNKLAMVQVMSTEDNERLNAFTSEKLVQYGMEGALYSVPAIILAGAITKASDRLALGAERGADSIGRSIENSGKDLSGSINGLSDSVNKTGISSVTDSFKNLNSSNGNSGTITTSDGTVIQGSVNIIK